MSRWIQLFGLVVGPLVITGCSMCCGPYDYEYPILDNCRYPRMDPEYGRVGSIYSDPNVGPGTVPLTNEDLPREPEPNLEDLEGLESDDPNFTTEDNDLDAFQPADPTPGILGTSAKKPRRFLPDDSWR